MYNDKNILYKCIILICIIHKIILVVIYFCFHNYFIIFYKIYLEIFSNIIFLNVILILYLEIYFRNRRISDHRWYSNINKCWRNMILYSIRTI